MKSYELKVFITTTESQCKECLEKLDRSAWIVLVQEKGVLCLSCAELDHLVFLPSGNHALTRRASKHSSLVALVLKWNRNSKHYERQGLLVEEKGLEQAEQECLNDKEIRLLRQEREAERRSQLDAHYIKSFAKKIEELYPSCPKKRAKLIAEHACLKYSGRVGRSAAAKQLDSEMIKLAVIAHIRHTETNYDYLLAMNIDRERARALVADSISCMLEKWQNA